MLQKAKKILKTVFGYDSFRPLQNDIIENILNKKDSLVIMPTGGGKSLCYQIPAIVFKGLTVVISPLISLMKDQAEQLRQLGVETAILNSSISASVYRDNYNAVKTGKAKLLYIAPESIFKDEIQELLISSKLECITIDEAHCISEWGHDFRKEYRMLGQLQDKFPTAVFVALTATATPKVQDDIVINLKLRNASRFLASFDRENLFLQVIPKQKAQQQALEFLKAHKDQSGIIYCTTRKQVDELYESLSALKYSCLPYHAGLPDEERHSNQERFIRDEIQIIIATVAFGMGINKSNIRYVLHYDLPKSIESYYQEIGRAGRDGLRADCLLLFGYGDSMKIQYFIEQKTTQQERLNAQIHLDEIIKFAQFGGCRRVPIINYFGEKYHTDNCGMCDNCVDDAATLVDITIPTQKILSAVKRTGERFGLTYIIDVLTGSESQRILSNRHHTLSVYGIEKSLTKKQLQYLCFDLIAKGFLEKDEEFGGLRLTSKSNEVLYSNLKVMGKIQEPEISTKKGKLLDTNYNKELFELLRAKRKQVADRLDVPPFVIFSDKTLQQMAVYFPRTDAEMADISGVGTAKLKSYSSSFLPVINKFLNTNKTVSPPAVSVSPAIPKTVKTAQKLRYIEVGEEVNNGATVDDLVLKYGIKPETVIAYIYKYAIEGNELQTNSLESNLTVEAELLAKVFEEFKKDDYLFLKPLYDKFEGKISYEQLRIIRILSIVKYGTKS